MLRLRNQAARHIRVPYICASCLSTTRNPLAGPGCRTFSSFSARCAPPAKETSGSDAEKGKSEKQRKQKVPVSKKAPPEKTVKTSPNKKAKQNRKPAKATEEASQTNNDTERQLKVLQGALTALKNVLSAQNINVDAITKPKRDEKSPQEKSPKLSKAEKVKVRTTLKHWKRDATVIKTAEKASTLDWNPTTTELVAKKTQEKTSTTAKSTPEAKISLESRIKRRTLPKEIGGEVNPPRFPLKTAIGTGMIDARGDRAATRKGRKLEKKRGVGPMKPAVGPMKPSGKSDFKSNLEITKISAADVFLMPIATKAQPPVPVLSYGLDRVLFNPGVYHLQDPRSRVYNFDPYLSKIMPIQEFDFTALKQYITSSKDENLMAITREHGKKYTGSTSSMTSMLSHFHYLLSAWREINSVMMSKGFPIPSISHTRIMRAPAAIFLHWKDGVYAIDADKEFDSANILSMLGKSMEKLLTLPREEFERYRHINSDHITEEERNAEEAFHYTSAGDFMMRSQLDAHDPRVPGTGMFDIKTRAVITIRMDARGYEKGVGYEIRRRYGEWESFEREYHDMIRSAFLKYSLQVRMGRMDGIFVAFHNTRRIFGFQYIPLEEMDLSLHGTSIPVLGHREFRLSLGLLNKILNRATEKFPKQSLRLFFETRQSAKTPFMYIFAKPVDPGEIEAVQQAGKAQVEEFERQVIGLGKQAAQDASGAEPASAADDAADEAVDEAADEAVDEVMEEDEFDGTETSSAEGLQDATTWEEVRLMVEDAMSDDEAGMGAIREAIEDALEQSGLIPVDTPEQARRYVDALLSAITGGQVSATSDASSIISNGLIQDPDHETGVHEHENAPSSTVDEGLDTQEAVDSESPETDQDQQLDQFSDTKSASSQEQYLHVSEESNGAAVVDSDVADTPLETSKEEEVEMEEDEDESDEVDKEEDEDESDEVDKEEDESSEDASLTPSMLTLKNLIMRMAQRIDEKKLAKEDEMDDAARLQEFERILGNMIALSKNGQGKEAESKPSAAHDASEPSQDTEQPVSDLSSQQEAPEEDEGEILGMVLTIRNKVNGEYVKRPSKLLKQDQWDVEYTIAELQNNRAWLLYRQCQARRRTVFMEARSDDEKWYHAFDGKLPDVSARGRKFRSSEDSRARKKPVFVYGEDGFKTYEDVFGFENESQGENEDSKKDGHEDEEHDGL